MKDTVFFKQAELLLRILPLIYKEEVFALKGGTAINFFVRDLPRLSVDIDLTYLPVNDRDFALNEIRSILLLISEGIKKCKMEAFEYFKNGSHKTSNGRSQAKRLSGCLIPSHTMPAMSDISQVFRPADTPRVWMDIWNDQFL